MKHSRSLSAMFAVVMLASCTASNGDQNSSIDPNDPGYQESNELPAGSFGNDGEGTFSGDVYVRGYADVQTVNEPFCVEDCQEFEYVVFTVLETGNDNLDDFFGVNEGNAYAGRAEIGLGCDEEGVIRFANHSDQFQMREQTLDTTTSQAILGSSEDAPVTLHLNKFPLSGGTEAPACYSHFTTIELAN